MGAFRRAMVEGDVKQDNFWASKRWVCCTFMMRNCNADVLKSARARNLEMLESCCKCGAWMDHADATDEEGDTALHIIIKGCWNYKEYLAEADRLGLQVDLRMRERCNLKSKLKPEGIDAKKALKAEIAEWNDKQLEDAECVELLCKHGHADPNHPNKRGQTALDLAADCDPDIIAQLEAQVNFLEEVAAEAEEED